MSIIKNIKSYLYGSYCNLNDLLKTKVIGYINTEENYFHSYSNCIPYIFYKPYMRSNRNIVYVLKKNKNFIILKKNVYISPIISSIKISNDDINYIDVTNIFNKYSHNFPLWFIINNEKLNTYLYLKISKKKLLNTSENKILIRNNINNTLNKIYNI